MPTFKFNGSDGVVYSMDGPEGSTQEQAQQFLGTLSKEQLKDYVWETPPEATVMERMMLGFDEAANITGNLGDFMVSHYPALATRWEPGEGGFLFAEDQYGEDFYELTPQERRDRISEVDTAKIQKEHANAIAASEAMASRGETDVARMVGGVGKAVADPAALVPVFGQAGKIKAAATAGQKVVAGTKVGATSGALFGGAYEASEGLKESGEVDPMDVAKGAAGGAVAGAVLGGVVSPIGAVATRGGRQRARIAKSKKSVSKADKLQNDYQDLVLIGKSQELSGADAHKFARQQLGLETKDLFEITQLTQRPIKTTTTSTQAAQELAARNVTKRIGANGRLASTNPGFYEQFVRPIDARLREISPQIYGRIMGMEQEVLSGMHKYHKETLPFRDEWRKMGRSFAGKKDRKQLGLALYNQNFDRARRIMVAYRGEKGGEAFDRMITALNGLSKEAGDAGIKFDTIRDYFPRTVKDLNGLMSHLGSNPKEFSKVKGALERAAKNKGVKSIEALEEAERIKIINRVLKSENKIRKSIGATKERKIDTINESMLKFYDDPITSIDLHIRDMTAGMQRRKLFGESLVETADGLEKLDESLGKMLDQMGHKIGSPNRGPLVDMLKARFGGGERGGNRTLQDLRTGTAGITLGNPISAALNLTDVGVTAWVKGLIPTLKGLPRAISETAKGAVGVESKFMNADTQGWMMEMAQEMSTGGRGSNFVRRSADALLRYGGFKLIDRFGKNVTIQASLNKARGQLKTPEGTKKFVREWGQVYDPQELQALMLDLKNGKMSDIAKAHIFSEVAEAPNGRVFYQFKTWGLRQLEVVRQRVLKNLMSGNVSDTAKGAKEAALLYMYVGGAGLGAREAQNFMKGRDSKVTNAAELSDEMFWAMMGNILFDRYNLSRLLEKGDAKGMATNYIVPPSIVIPGEIAIDAARGVITDDPKRWNKFAKSFGGIGRMVENLFMGGAEEYNEKLRKEQRNKILGRD